MSDSSKRLDLRFGAFACSVQGFDDPVVPVQQVLRALQTMIEESPELTDAGFSFDADAIEQLTEEVARRADLAEGDIEITPGLVIVYRGEGTARAGMDAHGGDEAGAMRDDGGRDDGDRDGGDRDGGDRDGGDEESWEQRFERVGAGRNGHATLDRSFGDDDGGEPADRDAGEPGGGHEAAGNGYVNIFAPRNGGGHRSALFGGDDSDSQADPDGYPDSDGPHGGTEEDVFASRLDRLASGSGEDSGEHSGEDSGEHSREDSYDSGSGGGGSLFADDDLSGGEVNMFSDGAAGEQSEESDLHGADLEEPLNLFSGSRGSQRSDVDETDAGDDIGDDAAESDRPTGNMLTSYDLRSRLSDSMSAPIEPEPEPEAEPEAVPEDEPFTAEKLAKAAEAETVEDLIVCSAAWMVLMKGQTKFGRRDVLDVFEKLPGDHPTTLEAKIKGFGKAVRNGHLIPVGEGIFGLSRSDLEDFQRLL